MSITNKTYSGWKKQLAVKPNPVRACWRESSLGLVRGLHGVPILDCDTLRVELGKFESRTPNFPG